MNIALAHRHSCALPATGRVVAGRWRMGGDVLPGPWTPTPSGWPALDELIATWAAREVLDYRKLIGAGAEEKAASFWLAQQWDLQFVEELKASIERAMSEGSSYSEWLKGAQGIVDRYGGSVKLYGSDEAGKIAPAYADLVFRTATQAAFAGGRYTAMFSPERLQQAPYVMYRTVGDNRVRPEHAALNGMVFRKDDLVARQYFPPSDFGCRCFLSDMDQTDFGDGGHVLSFGHDIPQLELPDGEMLGQPPDGWAVDRVEALRSRALAA